MKLVANVCITPAPTGFVENVEKQGKKKEPLAVVRTCDAVEAAHDGELVPGNSALLRRDLLAPLDHGNDVQEAERESGIEVGRERARACGAHLAGT
jgi:hypothetical protein